MRRGEKKRRVAILTLGEPAVETIVLPEHRIGGNSGSAHRHGVFGGTSGRRRRRRRRRPSGCGRGRGGVVIVVVAQRTLSSLQLLLLLAGWQDLELQDSQGSEQVVGIFTAHKFILDDAAAVAIENKRRGGRGRELKSRTRRGGGACPVRGSTRLTNDLGDAIGGKVARDARPKSY